MNSRLKIDLNTVVIPVSTLNLYAFPYVFNRHSYYDGFEKLLVLFPRHRYAHSQTHRHALILEHTHIHTHSYIHTHTHVPTHSYFPPPPSPFHSPPSISPPSPSSHFSLLPSLPLIFPSHITSLLSPSNPLPSIELRHHQVSARQSISLSNGCSYRIQVRPMHATSNVKSPYWEVEIRQQFRISLKHLMNVEWWVLFSAAIFEYRNKMLLFIVTSTVNATPHILCMCFLRDWHFPHSVLSILIPAFWRISISDIITLRTHCYQLISTYLQTS